MISLDILPKLPDGYVFFHYDTIDSTMEKAKDAVEEGAQNETYVVVAKSQTKGCGRQERPWHSPLGNLYISIAFPLAENTKQFAHYAFAAALTVKKTLDPLIGRGHLHFKWPNDILLHGKKIGGILPEVYRHSKTEKLFLIVGMGLNLIASPKEAMPYPVTSIMEALSIQLKPNDLIQNLIEAFSYYKKILETQGFQLIADEWGNTAHEQGEMLIIRQGTIHHKGVFCGIDNNGSLLLMDPTTHELKTIHTGDVGLATA